MECRKYLVNAVSLIQGTKSSIILHRDHPVTKIIFDDYHRAVAHCGIVKVCKEISQKC